MTILDADPPRLSTGLRLSLVASDLDGTFLSADGTVSEENSAAVLAAQAVGIPVVFATGRPIRWLGAVADLPGIHPVVIASNGAALYDVVTGAELDRICIPADVALTAVDRVRAAVPDAHVAFETGNRFGYEPGYATWFHDDGSDAALFHGPVEELAHSCAAVKLLVQSRSLDADALVVRVRDALGGLLTATHSSGRGFGLVELSAPGVSKVGMLARLCERLGVPARHVAAFGDMPNDVDMLRWAGMPHVMANAHPSLLAMGFPVVPPNTESGVGRTILDLLESEADQVGCAAAVHPVA